MGRTACTEPQCLYKGALYLYLYILFYSYMFRLVSIEPSSGRAFKNILYTIDNVLVTTRSRKGIVYNTFLKAQSEDSSIIMSRNM
jgi:hypothetical protein